MSQPTARREPVSETLHGETILDPYRWLERGDDPETRAFEAACNAETAAALAGPDRDAFRAAWLAWAAVPTYAAPRRVGRYVYFLEQPEGREQPRLCRTGVEAWERLATPPPVEVVLDPLQESGGQVTTALDWWYPSPSGRFVAYGLSHGGDEWSTLHVRDVDRGERLGDVIPRARMSTVAWLPDESGFYFTRFPWPGEPHGDDSHYHQHLFLHRLGRPAAEDEDVMGEGRERREHFRPQISPDGTWLVVTVFQGWTRTEVYGAPAEAPERLAPWLAGQEAIFDPHPTRHGLFVHTNWRAPFGRVLYLPWSRLLHQPPRAEDWTETVAERPGRTLSGIAPTLNGLWLHELEDAASTLRWVGSVPYSAPLPDLGTISGLAAGDDDDTAVVAFESFTRPPGLYAVAPGQPVERLLGADMPPLPAEVHRDWYTSTDGTRIPLFVVRPTDGTGPRRAILTGYGGFGLSSTPAFRRDAAAWVQSGGVWALAVLRGGGEYGEAWHEAGMRAHKQQVFDDCASAARHLMEAGETTAAGLAVWGASNGGLLAGAMLTQHPHLFGAVVIGVPLLDMLRYHRFLIADLWTGEYGSPDRPDEFRWLQAYSPYHRIQAGVAYPAVLLYAARNDSRVDPMHARKMAAALKWATASDRPVLLRIEDEAGHGVGKPLGRQADLAADVLAFCRRELSPDL
jgi:prolyl oligopeptidase